MTREEIESLYQEVELDRRWWGELPDTGDLLDKDFPQTADIYQLMPVCARIALHITGELPRVVFQKEPDAMPSFHAIVMNPEILSLKVSEKIRVEVFLVNTSTNWGIFVIAGIFLRIPLIPFGKNILCT